MRVNRCALNSKNLSTFRAKTVAKPAGTRIKIRKQSDRLDLIVPRQQSIDRAAWHQIAFTLAVDIAAALLVGTSLWMSGNINHLTAKAEVDRSAVIALAVGLLFTAPLALWLLGAAFKNSLEMCKQLFSDTLVSIEPKHIALSTQFCNFDWGTIRRIKVKDVNRIIVTDFQYIEGVSKAQAPCYVVLEMDQQSTVNLLAAEHRLSKAEAKWLGKEVSRWLDIELGSD
jgi:hypothetical protein